MHPYNNDIWCSVSDTARKIPLPNFMDSGSGSGSGFYKASSFGFLS